MARKRKRRQSKAFIHVSRRPDGKWEARKPGATRSSFVTFTEKEAFFRAKDAVIREGGGEVVVHHSILDPPDLTAEERWPPSVHIHTPYAGRWRPEDLKNARKAATDELTLAFLNEWRDRFGANVFEICANVGLSRGFFYKMAAKVGFKVHRYASEE